MSTENEENPAGGAGLPSDAPRLARRSRPAGRPPVHGLKTLRRAVTQLTTRRLDGRSAVAVAVRRWKEDVRRDLGDDLTRAQETILEAAAQSWVILSSLDDYIARQPSLVTRKRRVLDVVVQRMQFAEGLARNLERLGLERRAVDGGDATRALLEVRRLREAAAEAPHSPPASASSEPASLTSLTNPTNPTTEEKSIDCIRVEPPETVVGSEK